MKETNVDGKIIKSKKMKTFIIQFYELKDEAFDFSESDDEIDKEL